MFVVLCMSFVFIRPILKGPWTPLKNITHINYFRQPLLLLTVFEPLNVILMSRQNVVESEFINEEEPINHLWNIEGKYLLWFRKGVPTVTLQTMWCLLTPPAPFLSPCGELESWIGGTKGKVMSWEKKNLLETTMIYAINIKATILIKGCMRKANNSHMKGSPWGNWQYTNYHHTTPTWKGLLLPPEN